MNSDTGRGWTRHRMFGLRREWVQLYLQHPNEWRAVGGLGNRQVMSLEQWLVTAGLATKHGCETELCRLMRTAGLANLVNWERLWANVCLAFPTAWWYIRELGLGAWSVRELTTRLQSHTGLTERTCYDAICELVGLLERTPIGLELGQGGVSRDRPRLVRRTGLAQPGPEAILFATAAFSRVRGLMESPIMSTRSLFV